MNGGGRKFICNCNVVYRNTKRVHNNTEEMAGRRKGLEEGRGKKGRDLKGVSCIR